jgi:hypothetical protein
MVAAWIGDLNDPVFSMSSGSWGGNVPRRMGPEFPYSTVPFNAIIQKVNNGEFEGKQVDWGGTVAVVNKQQIIRFIEEVYPLPHNELLSERIKELKDYIENLEEGKSYALVACELS